MSILLLEQALKDLLETKMQELALVTKDRTGEEKIAYAKVFIADLPAKTQSNFSEVPFIVIQDLNGNLGSDSFEQAEIAIRIAVYNSDPETANFDLHNLRAFIIAELHQYRYKALAGRFLLCLDKSSQFFKWERPSEQVPPYAEAIIFTNWQFKGLE